MKNILVPIDGSEYSERALAKAKEIAAAFGCKITLLNVLSIVSAINYYPNMRFSHLDAILDWQSIVQEAKKTSAELMEKAKGTLGGIEVETVALDQPDGAIAKAIAEYANTHDVDMIVMGSNGAGSLTQRLYIGSVTMKTLHLVEKPVLVVQ